jgi:hypothetical protein
MSTEYESRTESTTPDSASPAISSAEKIGNAAMNGPDADIGAVAEAAEAATREVEKVTDETGEGIERGTSSGSGSTVPPLGIQSLERTAARWRELEAQAPTIPAEHLRSIAEYARAATHVARTYESFRNTPAAQLLDSPTFKLAVELEAKRIPTERIGWDYAAIAGQLAATAHLRNLIEGALSRAHAADLLNVVDRLTASYSVLASTPEAFAAMPAWLRDAPVLTTYTATRVAGVAAGLPADVLETERDPAGEAAIRGAADHLEMRLAAVGREFAEPYRGALEAMSRRGPDWVRHVSTSLRELLDALIDRLAPVSEMAQWIPQPTQEEFRDGKWTRKAQLRYIFRHVRTGGTERMTDNIIDAVLMLFYPQNAGVHTLATPHDTVGMEVMVAFTQGQLSTILTAAGY